MLVVPSNMAERTGDYVRSFILNQSPLWRPFAYRFASKASVMITDLFINAPWQINQSMNELHYDAPPGQFGEIKEETYEISGQFTVNDLMNASQFKISGAPGVIARSLSPTKLVVYYLYDGGVRSVDENRALLNADANTVVCDSRHSLVEDLGFTTEEVGDSMTRVSFTSSKPALVQETLEKIAKIFGSTVK